MKICAACSRELPRERFSNKQWQLKQHQRRCKECIDENREVTTLVDAPNDRSDNVSLPRSCCDSDGDGGPRWTDEELFKQPPPKEDCPICFLPPPLEEEGLQYYVCCGKMICLGCTHAAFTADHRDLCPFCRAPRPASSAEFLKRINKRVHANDAVATYNLGCEYLHGREGLQQDYEKAMELFLWAGKLGSAVAYGNVACSYSSGRGVERDEDKAKYYHELAAMGGDAISRNNLGCFDAEAGNIDRAVKHWMIAAEAGYDHSLENIRKSFMHGCATKDDFEKALRAHKEAKDEMKSAQREAVAGTHAMMRNRFRELGLPGIL